MARDPLKAEIQRLRPRLVELRRHFHLHPELSFEERETAAAIAGHLRRAGVEVMEGVGGYGVVGLIRGAKEGAMSGPTLLVRADVDALPIAEATGAEYTSESAGVMHACGHDGHTAIGLVLAELLAARRDELRGNVKFAFQPAEERVAGAESMIREGVLRDPDVDGVIGLHLWSRVPVGDVVAQAGAFWPSADELRLRVCGRGGHGAMPHENVDPIIIAAEILVALQTLVSREIPPLHAAVVTFGSIHGGTAGNIIADAVDLVGTVRAFEEADRRYLHRRISEVARGIAESLRGAAEFEVGVGVGPCVNDPEMTELVRRAAEATVGTEHIPTGDQRLSVSDDMALFLAAVPGCYFLVGAGNEARGIRAPHHSSRFDIDEDALPIGVEVLARAALAYLA